MNALTNFINNLVGDASGAVTTAEQDASVVKGYMLVTTALLLYIAFKQTRR